MEKSERIKIDLFPLEKMVFDGKEIYLGDNKQHIMKLLGNPENIFLQYGGETWRHYYYDSELALDYDKNGNLEFIEFLAGHEGLLKPYIYGVSAFDINMNELVTILSEYNNDMIDDSESDSYGFLGISVGIWKDDDNEDEDYWTTIGIGIKDYYAYDC
ncbi:MAG: hypothetical protein NC240_07335 [Clostridium sp.]|nr:hypothetical protein [Clostridium sp.]